MARAVREVDLFGERVRKAPPAPEFNTHCMIADILASPRLRAPGWKYTHIASGEFRTKATAGRLKRMGVVAGFPDFLLLAPRARRSLAHFLEIKRKGGRLTPAQAEFAGYCIWNGYPYACCEGFKEALDQLKAWGVVRSNVRVAA